MDGKLRNLRYITYAIEILLLYVLSGIPGFLPSILGSKPLLLLPVVQGKFDTPVVEQL